jgi:hypothetical protein
VSRESACSAGDRPCGQREERTSSLCAGFPANLVRIPRAVSPGVASRCRASRKSRVASHSRSAAESRASPCAGLLFRMFRLFRIRSEAQSSSRMVPPARSAARHCKTSTSRPDAPAIPVAGQGQAASDDPSPPRRRAAQPAGPETGKESAHTSGRKLTSGNTALTIGTCAASSAAASPLL